MKQTFGILVGVLLLSAVATAQDTLKKRKIGIDLAYAQPTYFKKDGFFPSLTFSTEKQVLFAGPSMVYYDEEHPKPMYGAQAGYRIFPNGMTKRFNLFLEANINYVNGKMEDRIFPYNSEYYWWSGSAKRTIHLVTLDHYVGFGCKWNLCKYLYLSSNIGWGIGIYKEDYTYEYPNGQVWTAKGRMFFREITGFNNMLFKIGIGSDFLRF